MERQVKLPLDIDGYLRRQCPQCLREFKWHHGPVEGAPHEPSAEVYFCPYCGVGAAPDQWFTQAQVETIHAEAVDAVLPELERELTQAMESLRRTGIIDVKVEQARRPTPPPPLIEQDDMVAVEPPCHPYEPVKVQTDWSSPIHCLVCGSRFVI